VQRSLFSKRSFADDGEIETSGLIFAGLAMLKKVSTIFTCRADSCKVENKASSEITQS